MNGVYLSNIARQLRSITNRSSSWRHLHCSESVVNTYTNKRQFDSLAGFHRALSQSTSPMMANKATNQTQPSVYTDLKTHGLILTIHLAQDSNVAGCTKVAAALQDYVAKISPPEASTPNDEIIAGVGFSQDFYAKLGRTTAKDFTYPARAGPVGDLPATGGDVIFHAKCEQQWRLFELAKHITQAFPKDSIANFEDVYTFVYKDFRDLSGFIDGTENPKEREHRMEVSIEKETGGSYAVAQRWVHKMDVLQSEPVETLEGWLGRTMADSEELEDKAITSHVARMTGGTSPEEESGIEIVRQSMPYGTLHGQAGLFFIAFAESPENFEFMLKRMVGQGDDPHGDNLMRFTVCVTGNYWYFPPNTELETLKTIKT